MNDWARQPRREYTSAGIVAPPSSSRYDEGKSKAPRGLDVGGPLRSCCVGFEKGKRGGIEGVLLDMRLAASQPAIPDVRAFPLS
jgi:hypothetical protein